MNEKQFGHSIIRELNNLGLDCTRIESHGTSVGIPDLFVQGYGYDMWIELKCDMKQSIEQAKFKVPWRPGQQAWMMRYFNAHNKNRCGVTLMRCKDGILVIAHVKVFDNCEVYTVPRCIGDCGCLNFCTISDKQHANKTFNLFKAIYSLCTQAMFNAQTRAVVLNEHEGWVAGKGDWKDE